MSAVAFFITTSIVCVSCLLNLLVYYNVANFIERLTVYYRVGYLFYSPYVYLETASVV